MRRIVISIKPKWAALIRSGRKTIELRRRFPFLPDGSTAYLYVSSPICSLTDVLRVGVIRKLSLSELWQSHGDASCIEESDFSEYFAGCSHGYGIQITRCTPLPRILSLAKLQSELSFTAPQSWAYAPDKLIKIAETAE